MKTPNYHDFYAMPLVPIGMNDLAALKGSDAYCPQLPSTHWLIAVEGVQLPQARIYFHWKVSIYPANSDGDFNWKKPFYCSANMETIDSAIAIASMFGASAKNDHLFPSILLEKIS